MKNRLLAILAVSLVAGPMAANAVVVTGTVPAFGIDYLHFTSGGGLASFNIWAYGFTGGPTGTGLYDSVITLVVDDGSPIGSLTGVRVGGNDDSSAAGWDSDGSTAVIDSFFSVDLAPGSYILGIGAFYMSADEFRSGVANTPSTPGDYQLTFSGVDIVSVPEPSSLALFGLGLAGLGLTRRRKPNTHRGRIVKTGIISGLALATVAISVVAAPGGNKPTKPPGGGTEKAPRYSMVEIVVPNEEDCAPEATRDISARRLNESSQLVGFSTCYVPTGEPSAPYSERGLRGFSWSPSTGGQLLTPVGALSSADMSFVRDINEMGDIVGYEVSTIGFEAVRWSFGSAEGSAAFQPSSVCATDPRSYTRAMAIDDSGGVIGAERTLDVTTGNCRSFTWVYVDKDGEKIFGPQGIPYAMNSGLIGVGVANVNFGQNAIKWSPDANETTILAEGNFTEGAEYLSVIPLSINDLGDVAAYWSAGTDENGCFLDTLPMYFRSGGGAVFLPALGKLSHGTAYGINNSGEIVGETYSAEPCGISTDRSATLWKLGSVYDLNKLIPRNSGVHLTAAYAVNNVGQIVVYGTVNAEAEKPCPYYRSDPAGPPAVYVEAYCKPQHSFLLTPK